MLSDRQQLQLEIIDDISEISEKYSTKTWIWGGLALDIHHGRFLREHHDIDGFTLNLLDVRQDFEAEFLQRGYSVNYLESVDMLQVKKNGIEEVFNRLEIEGNTALWRHIGDEGAILFPKAWLSDKRYDFYDTGSLISGAELEYSIKTNVKLLSPEWQPRPQDEESLACWTGVLKGRTIDPETLLRDIRCDNPWWRKRGYTEY